MSKFTITTILVITFFALQAQTITIQTKKNYTSGWSNRQVKLVSLIPGYTSVEDGSDDFSRNGMYKHLRSDSTGFYYVKKIDDRWWLVDPEGYAGIKMAVTSFTHGSIQGNYDIIKRNGFNGTANFLANEDQTRDFYNAQNYQNFSYTRRPNFFLSYKNVRHNYYPTPQQVSGSLNHILVLDSAFAEFCDEHARTRVLPYANERDLLGYYTDNEINFNQDQLTNLIKDLQPGDPSREAALAFAQSKGLTLDDVINNSSKVTEAIKREFAALLARHYYKTVSEAIRKYDQNHLILGSRLHGRPRAIPGVVEASHEYMDVTSVNFYDRFTPNEQIAMNSWTQDHPVIVGEAYSKDINIFNSAQPGAGWYVNGQKERGYFYQNMALELLQNKCYIGWDYFRFQDDPDSNKGMVSYGSNPQEYTEMTALMEELNKQVYRLADFYDGKNRRPQQDQYVRTLYASADTWVLGAEDSNDNYGTDTQMEVYYSWTENNRREAFIKFDLDEYLHNELANLKNARLEFELTEANGANRSLFISGLENDTWQENSLTGATRYGNPDLRTDANRLAFNKGNLETGTISFDVTTWMSDKKEKDVFSFKLHDLTETMTSLRLASREHPDASMHPRLVLTFWGEDQFASSKTEKPMNFSFFVDHDKRLYISDSNNAFNEYQVFNMSGQMLLMGNLNNASIDASSLKTGVYILRLRGRVDAARKLVIL